MVKPDLYNDTERTTSVGLARYATEFFEAALAVNDKLGKNDSLVNVASVPVMYLFGHSIELALKAYLLAKGLKLKVLKYDYGHNLLRSFIKAKELGLIDVIALSTEEDSTLARLNTLYSTKQLQYIVTGTKQGVPCFEPLESLARKLVYGIAPIAGYPKIAPPH
jgi:hypothetical protein